MNKIIFPLLLLFLNSSSKASAQEKSRSLFNGKDLTGWHWDVPEMYNNAGAANPFIIRNGLLVSLGQPGGHLINDDIFMNYRLEVKYRFSALPSLLVVLQELLNKAYNSLMK